MVKVIVYVFDEKALILCGFCVCPCFVVHYFVSFLVCNHIEEEERVGCFAFLSYGWLVTVNVL